MDFTDLAPYLRSFDIGSPILWLHHLSLSPGDVVLYSGDEETGEYHDWDFIALNPQEVLMIEGEENRGEELTRLDHFVHQPWRNENGEIYSDEAWFTLGQTIQVIPPMVYCAIGYEVGSHTKGIAPREEAHLAPTLWAARYDAIYAYYRPTSQGWLVACTLDTLHNLQYKLEQAYRLQNAEASSRSVFSSPAKAWIKEPFKPSLDYPHYKKRFDQLKEAILSGDVYQMNLTLPLETTLHNNVDTAPLFQHLCSVNAGQFSALYMIDDSRSILSLSPERLAKWSGRLGGFVDRKRWIETAPIKGTRPRQLNPIADEAERQDLLNSEKDAAEHVMILDLERNDLGQICESGTVLVTTDREAKRYATVHHLVSVVKGELSSDKDLLDILYAIFPGGSVTGAPKIRSMELIRHLESESRGIYCGALGYLDPCGGGDLNLPIRTLFRQRERLVYHAGGGIVADSEPDEEWQELWVKTNGVQTTLLGLPSAEDT